MHAYFKIGMDRSVNRSVNHFGHFDPSSTPYSLDQIQLDHWTWTSPCNVSSGVTKFSIFDNFARNSSLINSISSRFYRNNIFILFHSFLYPPPKRSFKGGILFSRCPSVRPCMRLSVRPSVTFCFFNILKTH